MDSKNVYELVTSLLLKTYDSNELDNKLQEIQNMYFYMPLGIKADDQDNEIYSALIKTMQESNKYILSATVAINKEIIGKLVDSFSSMNHDVSEEMTRNIKHFEQTVMDTSKLTIEDRNLLMSNLNSSLEKSRLNFEKNLKKVNKRNLIFQGGLILLFLIIIIIILI